MQRKISFFGENPLNRLHHLRGDASALDALKQGTTSCFIVLHDNSIVTDNENELRYFSRFDLDVLNIAYNEAVLLGTYNELVYFALDLSTLQPGMPPLWPLRKFISTVALLPQHAGIIAQAAAVLNWHRTCGYCATCGARSSMTFGGWRRDCTACGKEHFPRTDPVVIMLVTCGDACLLGQGVRYTSRTYSCLAGFMESGETVEDAARRELFEETGLKGNKVTYMLSQPWPFPVSLMIGVWVEVDTKDLAIDHEELVDCKWVEKDKLRAILKDPGRADFGLPGSFAIARDLLDMWVGEE